MIAPEIVLWLGLLLVGLACSALFSGLEIGIYTLNRVRLAVRSSRGERVALMLRRETRRGSRLLVVLLIGNNASNYLASFGLAEYLHRFELSDWTTVLIVAGIFTPLVFVFGETLPKDLFRTHTDRWTYRLAPVLVAARWLFTIVLILPLVQLVAALINRLAHQGGAAAGTARQRISQLIREGAGAGVIRETQMTLADRALAMRTRKVRSEMIRWSQVATLPLDATIALREAIIASVRYTRLPVVDSAGRPVGVINTLDAVLDRDKPTHELMYEIITLPPEMPAVQALQVMRAQDRRMAVVLDPKTKQPRGLVTLKDLVEPLTGELAVW